MKLYLTVALLSISSLVAQTQTTTVKKTVEQAPTVATQNTEQTKTFTGTLSGVDPAQSTLTLSSEGSSSPLRYSYSDNTKFYDDDGHALTPQALESGSIAKLTYLQTGTTLVVVKAIFSKPAPPVVTEQVVAASPPVIVRKTIVVQPTPAYMVEETTTTTTTTNP